MYIYGDTHLKKEGKMGKSGLYSWVHLKVAFAIIDQFVRIQGTDQILPSRGEGQIKLSYSYFSSMAWIPL